jgi:hypothetical protein
VVLRLAGKKSFYLQIAGILLLINACIFLFLMASIIFLLMANSGRTISLSLLPFGIAFFTFLTFALNLLGGFSFWRKKYSVSALLGIGLTIFYCLILMFLTRVNIAFGLIIVLSVLTVVFTVLSKREPLNSGS